MTSVSLPRSLRRGAGLLLVLLVAVPGLSAQTGSITGTIMDTGSGLPVASAQVFIAELDLGVLSQQNGSYNLQNVPAGTQTVTVQRLGYREAAQTVQVTAGDPVVVNFAITESALQLDEVIVTGTPGGTQRRAIGNTVARLDASTVLQDVAVTNMQDLLTARTPSLRFTNLMGNVGAGSSITIRGVGSFSDARNDPLIYVDGVRVNNESQAGPITGEGGIVNVLNDFNPEEIESIEVIKGPAAASLYGTEASAGVIQIITKRGNEGAPQFNLSVRQGSNFLIDPAEMLGTLWTCPTDPSPGPTDCSQESELAPYNMVEEANRYIREGYFPWPRQDLFSYGHTQSYNVDVRGGTETIRYFLSSGFDDEEGVLWFNTNERKSARANIGVLLSEALSLDVSMGYADGYTRFATPVRGDGGIWQDLVWSNGFYLDRINPFNTPRANPRLGGFQEHLPSDVAEVMATRDFSRFTGSATLNYTSPDFSFWDIDGSLTQRLVVGIDKSWDTNQAVFPIEDGVVPEHLREYTDTWAAQYSETQTGEMTYDRPIQTNLSFDYATTLNLQPNDVWRFSTSFGAQYYVDQLDRFQNEGNGFASTLSRTINQLSQSQILTSYWFIENKSLGVYVQEEVGWNDRLFLTGAVRFDDNSTFGVDAPAQRYPKVSGTWVISEESFWNIDQISSLRLRGAWGKAGRQPSSTSGQNIYVAIPGPGGSAAIRPSSPGNPGIEPEVSTEIEAGFDIALFDDRISAEFTNYHRRNEQALLNLAALSSFGFPGSVSENLGRIDNWGWETLVSARIYENSALAFDLDLSADFTGNEIRDLGDYPGSTRIRVGYPYPNFVTDNWVLRAEFDPNGRYRNAFGEAMNGWCDEGTSLAPEGAENPNLYGRVPSGVEQPCQDIFDQRILAGPAYDRYTFTVAPRLTLLQGQLQFFALAEGRYGRINQDSAHQWGHTYNNSKISRLENEAQWAVSERLNRSGASWELEIYKGGFWKLREVGARYSLPQALVQRTGAERATVSFSARNAWIMWQEQKEIWGLPIPDPEFGDPNDLDGSNVYSTPGMTSLNATLRVTF